MHQRDALKALVQKYKITKAAMETPPVGPNGAWSQEKLYALYVYNMEVMYTEKVDIILVAPLQLQLFAKVWGSGTVSGDWFKSDMQERSRVDLLDLYTYPKHKDYYDNSPTKLEKIRKLGYEKNPFPIVDVASYPKDIRKQLKIQSDEADAYLLSKFASRFWNFYDKLIPEEDLTPSEWDVFAKIKTYTKGDKKGVVDRDGIIYKEEARFFRFATSTKYSPLRGDLIITGENDG